MPLAGVRDESETGGRVEKGPASISSGPTATARCEDDVWSPFQLMSQGQIGGLENTRSVRHSRFPKGLMADS